MDRSVLYSSPHEPRTVFCILALKGSDLHVQLSVLKIKPLFPVIHQHSPSAYGGAIAVKIERRHSSKFRIEKLYLTLPFLRVQKGAFKCHGEFFVLMFASHLSRHH